MNGNHRQTLEEALRRISAAIDRAEQREKAIDRFGKGRRWEKRLAREARRRASRKSDPADGAIRLIAAAFVGYMAYQSPNLWWLVLFAVGLAISGIRKIFRYSAEQLESEREKEAGSGETTSEQRGAGPKSQVKTTGEIDKSLARVDQWCERLLAEIKRGPEVLRDLIRKPEETVQGIRQGCHALAKREGELRALVTPEDDQRLALERKSLANRLEAEQDEITRQRLSAAIVALDEQRKQRSELLTAASRMEAERTRLSYVLENLYTQVLRVRSADSASAQIAGQGLKKSMDSLGEEISAVADALESVNREPTVLAPVSSPPESSPEAPSRVREKG